MTRIIDLGNGYARMEGYGSRYASLTFLLTLSAVRKLYVRGYLSRDEFQQILLDMGYSEQQAAWVVALDSVPIKEWRDKVRGLGTI